MKTLPVAVYVRDKAENTYRRQGTWPRVPYVHMALTCGRIVIEVDEGAENAPSVIANGPRGRGEDIYHVYITLPSFSKQDENVDPEQAWRPVLNPPPTHRYIERCCGNCKFHRDADFQHWVVCAGPARDMICQGLVTRHDAPPILVEKRFCCKFYEGIK